MREEIPVLWEIGDFQLTAYGLCMAIGALIACFVCLSVMHRRGASREASVHVAMIALFSALVGGHLVYCLCMAPMLEADYGGYALFWMFHRGGVTLYGAILGILVGLGISCHLRHEPLGRILDAMTPAASIALIIGRIAEMFTTQGLGLMVESALFQRLPFAVCTYMDEDWSEWYIPVFLWEALLGLLLLFLSVHWLHGQKADGEVAVRFLTILGCGQIFLEQLRQDDCIRFGFVRFTQLAALAVILGCLLFAWRGQPRWYRIIAFVRITCCALTVVFIEFALEKPQFNGLLRATNIATFLAFLPVWTQKKWFKKDFVLASLFLILTVAFCLALGRELPLESQMLYTWMGLSLYGMGSVVFQALVKGHETLRA